jgi:small subunit ribosomal protein S18
MAPATKDRSRSKTGEAKGRIRRGKPKVCVFCAEHIAWVDYKDTNLLRRFMTDRGKIKARGNTGTCAQHQRDVATAVKTARELALLPYVVRTLAADKAGGRRGRGPGRAGGRPSDEAPAPDQAAEATEPESEPSVAPDVAGEEVAAGVE